VPAVDGLEALLELARQARDAADDPDRRRVELGALAPPLLEDDVDPVALRHGGRA
jgi:hypothetical protein